MDVKGIERGIKQDPCSQEACNPVNNSDVSDYNTTVFTEGPESEEWEVIKNKHKPLHPFSPTPERWTLGETVRSVPSWRGASDMWLKYFVHTLEVKNDGDHD